MPPAELNIPPPRPMPPIPPAPPLPATPAPPMPPLPPWFAALCRLAARVPSPAEAAGTAQVPLGRIAENQNRRGREIDRRRMR